MPETTDRSWRSIDPPSDRPATAARPSRCPDDEQVDPDATPATTVPKCRACIEQGIPGECTDPAHQVAPGIGPEVIAERSTRVRMRIPNTPDSGVVWDDEEVPRIVGQTPLVTNRAYVLDKDRWGHVPLVNDEPVHALIVGAEAEDGAVLLHLVIDNAEIATLLTEYGDPCPGYAAHQFGWDAPRVCEVGPAKAPEPQAFAKSGLELEQATDAVLLSGAVRAAGETGGPGAGARRTVPPEALSAALAAWDARITGPIVSDTEGTEDALQEVVEAAFRAVPGRAPEPPVALRHVDRGRRALRAFIEHLDAAPSATVLDALNSALLAYDPPPNEPPGDDLRVALKVVADGRAYTREHFSRPPTGYVGHTPAAEYDAAVDAIVAGLTDILDSTQSGPSPHADLREAIARALAAANDDGVFDEADRPDADVDLDSDEDVAWYRKLADAVLPAVQQARAEGAAEVAEWRGRFCDAGLHLRTHRSDGRCWACDRDARRAACPHEGEPVEGMAVLGPVWDCRTCGKRLGEYDGLTYSEMRARIAAGGEL